MSIDEWWNRFAQSFYNRQNTLFDVGHWTFDAYSPPLVDSIFAFSKFLFRFDWTLAASGGARMKHRLLQKCSFFLIKLAVFLDSGGVHMILHKIKVL